MSFTISTAICSSVALDNGSNGYLDASMPALDAAEAAKAKKIMDVMAKVAVNDLRDAFLLLANNNLNWNKIQKVFYDRVAQIENSTTVPAEKNRRLSLLVAALLLRGSHHESWAAFLEPADQTQMSAVLSCMNFSSGRGASARVSPEDLTVVRAQKVAGPLIGQFCARLTTVAAVSGNPSVSEVTDALILHMSIFSFIPVPMKASDLGSLIAVHLDIAAKRINAANASRASHGSSASGDEWATRTMKQFFKCLELPRPVQATGSWLNTWFSAHEVIDTNSNAAIDGKYAWELERSLSTRIENLSANLHTYTTVINNEVGRLEETIAARF